MSPVNSEKIMRIVHGSGCGESAKAFLVSDINTVSCYVIHLATPTVFVLTEVNGVVVVVSTVVGRVVVVAGVSVVLETGVSCE